MARSLVWGNGKGNGNRATRRRNNWTTGKRTLFARSKSLWIIARALSSATKERIDSWTRRDDWKINQTWKTQNHLDFFRRILCALMTWDFHFSSRMVMKLANMNLRQSFLRLITHALDLNQHNHPFRMKIGGGVDIFTATTTTTPM